MDGFLAWLEASALGHAVRGAGVWTYGVVNLIHILGVSSLFGSVLVLDLRLLGLWRSVPLAAIARPAEAVAAAGFLVAAGSGICLLATNATEYIGNPFLLIKFPAILVGVVNAAILRRATAWNERGTRMLTAGEERRLAIAGAISLLSWVTAVGAGRLIGYW